MLKPKTLKLNTVLVIMCLHNKDSVILLYLLAVFLFPHFAIAQEYTYRHYSPEDAVNPLPGSSSYAIIQDDAGFIWFSVIGGGLNRYDGREYVQFKSSDPYKPSLDYVTGLHQDGNGYLWASTTGGLLITARPLYENSYSDIPAFTDSLITQNGAIALYSGETLAYGQDAFAGDPDTGGIWAATGLAGLIHYSMDEQGFWRADSLLAGDLFPDFDINVNDTYSVLIRQNGELVFLTRGGYIGVLEREQKMAFLNGEAFALSGFSRFSNAAAIGVHIALTEDSKGRLWGGTTLGRIWMIDGALSGQMADADSNFSPGHIAEAGQVMVFQLAEDNNGTIWAGTSSGAGIINYDKGKKFRRLSGVTGLGVNTLWVDREGNIWLGSHNGIFKFRHNYENFTIIRNEAYPFTLDKEVVSVEGSIYDDSVIWMGTHSGMIEATETNSGYEFELFATEKTGLEPYVYAIRQHPDGTVWVGVNNGFYIIRPDTVAIDGSYFRNRTPDFTGRASQARSVFAFKQDNSVTGIDHEVVNGRIFTFLYDNNIVNVVIDNEIITLGRVTDNPRPGINAVSIGPDGHIWISTNVEGLLRSRIGVNDLLEDNEILQLSRKPREQQVTSEFFQQILVDSEPADGTIKKPIFTDNKLIITTGIGVIAYEPEVGDESGYRWEKVNHWSTENGLNHDFPSGLLYDEQSNLIWTGGPKGINAIDPYRGRVVLSAGKRDGMVEEFIWGNRAFQLHHGSVLFGTSRGLIRFKPPETPTADDGPAIRILDLVLEQNRFGKNRLEVRYTAPYFTDEMDIDFMYRIRGYDSDWIFAGKNTFSRYTNLPAFGTSKRYLFEVKSVNGNGQESQSPAVHEFFIHPPVYLQWWFLLLAAGGFLFGIVFAVRRRDRINKEKQEQIALNQQFEITQRIGASVAHDMKNSVFSLTFLARNLEKRFDNKAFRDDAIETLQKTTEHLNSLIEKFQHQNKSWDINRNKSSIRDTIQSVIKRFGIQADSNIKLTFDGVDNPEWPHDSGAIERILENLFKNAMEAMPDGGQITVSLNEISKWNTIRILVSDTGIGMTKEFMREKLFQPFITTKKQGVGLGLYSVKQLVKAHDGNITVESETGRGTTFILEFLKG